MFNESQYIKNKGEKLSEHRSYIFGQWIVCNYLRQRFDYKN